MDKNYTGIFLRTGILAGVFLVINMFLYRFLIVPVQEFHYSLPLVYIFFLAFSLIILGVLVKISIKKHEQLGYAFLLLTSIKMAASYFLARPIIAHSAENPAEKVNFFVIFILFLAIEAYYTARLLNNKQ